MHHTTPHIHHTAHGNNCKRGTHRASAPQAPQRAPRRDNLSPQCADFADLASTSAEPAACFRDEASHGGVNMTSRSIANVIDPRPNPETCARLPRGVEASGGAARLSSRHAPPAAAAAPSTPPSAAIAPLASSFLVQAAWSKRGLRGARAASWARPARLQLPRSSSVEQARAARRTSGVVGKGWQTARPRARPAPEAPSAAVAALAPPARCGV